MPHTRLLTIAFIIGAAGLDAQEVRRDSTWRDHDAAGRAARERGDWRAAVRHYQILDSAVFGSPRVTLAIARAYANLADTAGSLAALRRYAQMGLTYDVAADEQLRAMTSVRGFAKIQQRIVANARLSKSPRIVATMPAGDFIAEGIAYDARRKRLLVSSIRLGTIVSVSGDGTSREFIDLVRDGAWSGLALAVDSVRDRLWVTSMWMPHAPRVSAADSLRSALLLYDLARGGRLARYDFQRGNHEPGDICLSSDGDVFVSDGRAGVMYVLRNGADSLSLLVSPGHLIAPQGCAVDSSGGAARVLVADYALGIASIDPSTGGVSWLPRSSHVAATGIDGLLLDGDRLIGVQNGVEPNRIIAMHLDADHQSIGSISVVAQDTGVIREPTHVVRMGADIAFIANSGFGAFDAAGKRRPESRLRAPVVARVHVGPAATTRNAARVESGLLAADIALAKTSARNPSSFLAAASGDAPILFPQNPILRARDARTAFVMRYPASGSYTWRPQHAVVGADDKFGCTIGTSLYRFADSVGTRAGSYVTCWKRESLNSPWRIVAHQRNDDQADSGARDIPANAFPRSAIHLDGSSGIESVLAADEAFARRGAQPPNPGLAFAAYAAEDALLLSPPDYPTSRRGIHHALAGYPANRVLLWEPDRAYGDGSGGLAFTVGYSLARDRGESPGRTVAGKYFTVWRQAASGRWEYIIDQASPGR